MNKELITKYRAVELAKKAGGFAVTYPGSPTMFHDLCNAVAQEGYALAVEHAANICSLWNTSNGEALAKEIRGLLK